MHNALRVVRAWVLPYSRHAVALQVGAGPISIAERGVPLRARHRTVVGLRTAIVFQLTELVMKMITCQDRLGTYSAFPINRSKWNHFHREFTPILDLFLPINGKRIVAKEPGSRRTQKRVWPSSSKRTAQESHRSSSHCAPHNATSTGHTLCVSHSCILYLVHIQNGATLQHHRDTRIVLRIRAY